MLTLYVINLIFVLIISYSNKELLCYIKIYYLKFMVKMRSYEELFSHFPILK